MEPRKIALVGNPNTGKTSLFNLLTGMNQHVGNFPGVTVDKKTGTFVVSPTRHMPVLDLPGTYSIFPRSRDEKVVFDILSDAGHPDHPDLVLAIADASNLERNLLLFTQVRDLGLPVILVLTMEDVAAERAMEIHDGRLRAALGVPVVRVNGRSGEGMDVLKQTIAHYECAVPERSFGNRDLRQLISDPDGQRRDAEERFAAIRAMLATAVRRKKAPVPHALSARFDRWLVHPVFGYAFFLVVLLLIFQFIFHIASYPMDWIDGAFLEASQAIARSLPAGVLTDLLAEGVLPGIGGVVVFIPQIALLFFFLSILEETGYMARVVFIMDKLVRPFGLNGKSVVPLMSSVACAIPGIMATRTISAWKDRLITIMVAPLMSCSARIPVFTLLIALIIPEEKVWGFFSLQGLVLLALYLLGLVSALLVAAVMKYFIATTERSVLLLELPVYQVPRWKQVLLTVWEKVRVFVVDAGKVIMAISIILWALASYGPPGSMDAAEMAVRQEDALNGWTLEDHERAIAAARLEHSYIGIVGRAIEPVIEPIGYDWKIGIALITSFAAREVFVGSMATIYSVGGDGEDERTLVERLRAEQRPDGTPVYTVASGASLMIFYVFAMQCMATFAVVKRETKSWKWPLIQVFYMGVLAYTFAWITFVLLS